MSNGHDPQISAGRIPDAKSEQRLTAIRQEAELRGEVKSGGIRPAGAPFPIASPETGYYGIPMLKEPAWTWEIPLYFFVGGAAGTAAVIGAIADYTGTNRKLVRDAQWIAAAGVVISPVLLILDLGKPSRFLNMLRVFKPQSAMWVGVWTLMGFSGGSSLSIRLLEQTGQAAALLFRLPFSNYTGVLIGATAIPVWNLNAGELPIHFGASGLGAAVGMLELAGHDKSRALQGLGTGAAVIESLEGLRIESRDQEGLSPLKRGLSGAVVRIGGLLSGPLPLALRAASMATGGKTSRKLRRLAALSSVAGSLITRIGWVHAGHVSARDWRLPLRIPPSREIIPGPPNSPERA
jgi:hypothetical protein